MKTESSIVEQSVRVINVHVEIEQLRGEPHWEELFLFDGDKVRPQSRRLVFQYWPTFSDEMSIENESFSQRLEFQQWIFFSTKLNRPCSPNRFAPSGDRVLGDWTAEIFWKKKSKNRQEKSVVFNFLPANFVGCPKYFRVALIELWSARLNQNLGTEPKKFSRSKKSCLDDKTFEPQSKSLRALHLSVRIGSADLHWLLSHPVNKKNHFGNRKQLFSTILPPTATTLAVFAEIQNRKILHLELKWKSEILLLALRLCSTLWIRNLDHRREKFLLSENHREIFF